MGDNLINFKKLFCSKIRSRVFSWCWCRLTRGQLEQWNECGDFCGEPEQRSVEYEHEHWVSVCLSGLRPDLEVMM